MKKVIFMMALCGLFVFGCGAQDMCANTTDSTKKELACEDLMTYTHDKVTGQKNYGITSIVTWKIKMGLVVRCDTYKTSSGVKMWTFSFSDDRIIGSEESFYVLFTDGSNLALKSSVYMSTNGMFVVQPNDAALKQLATKKIETVRWYTYNDVMEYNVTTDDADRWKKIFDCMRFYKFK